MLSGIYKITNKINSKFYIGSSFNIDKRKREHLYKLNNNIHHNKYLQNAWNKYGENNFEFLVIAKCPQEYLIKLENFFLKQLKPVYNIAPEAGTTYGYKHTIDTKNKFKSIIQDRKDSKKTNKALKLTYDEVFNIKKLYALNVDYKQIAFLYKISPSTVHSIINKNIWKEVPDYTIQENDIVLNKQRIVKGYKYSDEFLLQILKEYKETNCTMLSLRIKYNMTKYLDNVLKGKSKKHLQKLI